MTSLRKDRIRKARIYARSGVPEYWTFDLVNVCVHVHRDPAGDAYTSIETFYPPAELKTLSLPLPPVPLGELLSSR
jgi:Uma2 family endonuclease